MNASPETGVPVRRLWRAIVVVCVVACAYILLNSLPTPFDDAYMFIRYANNLLAGHGHAWNPNGVQVFGSTSLLHLGVVTSLKGCLPRVSDATVLLLASAMPAFCALVVLVVACAQSAQHRMLHNNYWLWGALLLPSLILQETFRYHLRTGMDTMTSLLCNALLIFFTMRLVRRGSIRGMVPVLVTSYLTYVARPDNGIYATVFPALCILLLGSGPRRKLVIFFSLAIVAILSADLVVKRLLLGTALPLPFYAKQHGVYQGYAGKHFWNPVIYLQTFCWVAMPFLCMILFFIQRRSMRTLVAFLLPVALTFAYYFSVNQIMGYHARFYFPALPFFVVAAAMLIDDWSRSHEDNEFLGQTQFLLRLTVTLLVILGGRQATYTMAAVYERAFLQPPVVEEYRGYEIDAPAPLPEVDGKATMKGLLHLVREAPQGTILALSEHGEVGAAAPQLTLIDLVGLHDREFALHGFSAKELFRRKPDLIWFPHYHYTKMVQQILQSDELWEDYLYYPGAFRLGLAIRKDSPRFDELSALLKESWKMVHGDLPEERYLARPVAGSHCE